MVYKRYRSPFEDNSNNFYTQDYATTENEPFKEDTPQIEQQPQNPGSPGFLDNLEYDDIILIGLIVILLAEEKEKRDVPLILTLGFLFLIQYIDMD